MNVVYYRTSSGRSPVKEFVDDLPFAVAADFALAVDRLENAESLEMPLSRPLFEIARSLYELRFHDRNNIFRVVYYVRKKDAIYLLHGYTKKTQKIPEKEKMLIRRRLKNITG